MVKSENLLYPKHPERVCWGCDLFCPPHDLRCRESRVPHPIEPFGGCGPEGSIYAIKDIAAAPPASPAPGAETIPRR